MYRRFGRFAEHAGEVPVERVAIASLAREPIANQRLLADARCL
jgi:hypothetical protein